MRVSDQLGALWRGWASTLISLLAAAAIFMCAPLNASANGPFIEFQDTPNVQKVRIVVNKSTTLQLGQPIGEALIANADIADVVPLSDTSLYLVGKKIGLSRMALLRPNKALLGIVEIEVSYDVGALKAELRRNIPDGDFTIRTANGNLILAGAAPDAVAVEKASKIAEQFAPGGVLNTMTVRAPQQVLLEVRFVEAARSASRNLGLSWDVKSSDVRGISGGVPLIPTPNGILDSASVVTGFPSGSVPFSTFLARILDNGTRADVVIQALEAKGLARRLAEPNLVTLSGDTANFLAGGEFPFPLDAGDNKIAIEFKKFGIGLAFTPTVLSEGQINLKIEPEVSDLDFTNEVIVNGTRIPSLVVRRANTTVELRDGQSFAIAGLLAQTNRRNARQLPWIGQVPVLGALFTSASFEKKESDLVIIVTPRLVRPAAPGQRLATPLDQKLPSNDKDYFVKGRLEINKHEARPYGHVLDVYAGWEPRTVIGKDGHAPYK